MNFDLEKNVYVIDKNNLCMYLISIACFLLQVQWKLVHLPHQLNQLQQVQVCIRNNNVN
jgi:hypothetical protein